ncbi:calcium homeostasis modulator protein 6-like isoform X2 [Talpa occidentalis]|uniref:calcium homeostasis modulator protein 6-like isoform X2 n=1 Tax=Talpa occidentalis TaxID=50954 RepID=UPI00188E3505|nr:calcium homeostasis modulator protein 6-like isoform X2 [Talpa occidentalis]
MATLVKTILEKFPTLLDLQLKHGSKLGYGLVSLLTAGGERIFSTAVFQCPCHPTWNLPYGMVFLLVPGLALFLLGYVLNTSTWRLTTGCCRQDCSQLCTCGSQSWKEFLWISATSLVAPLSWVAVGLLGGTFYECSASGIPSLARRLCLDRYENCSRLMPKLPCLRNLEPDLLKALQAQSQYEKIIPDRQLLVTFQRGSCCSACICSTSMYRVRVIFHSINSMPRKLLPLQNEGENGVENKPHLKLSTVPAFNITENIKILIFLELD